MCVSELVVSIQLRIKEKYSHYTILLTFYFVIQSNFIGIMFYNCCNFLSFLCDLFQMLKSL